MTTITQNKEAPGAPVKTQGFLEISKEDLDSVSRNLF